LNQYFLLKAETHNFPTTGTFQQTATGPGGEIRDRLAGGQGFFTFGRTAAVYMTLFRLTNNRKHEEAMAERPWLYQTPMDI
jgi:phosphoribosylformylglycinamidine synthase